MRNLRPLVVPSKGRSEKAAPASGGEPLLKIDAWCGLAAARKPTTCGRKRFRQLYRASAFIGMCRINAEVVAAFRTCGLR